MNVEDGPRAELDRHIEAIESGYEFLLAYAAQGRDTDRGAGAGRNVREFLEAMQAALEGLGAVVRECIARRGGATAESAGAFLEALDRDAAVARSAVRLVLAQPDIGSQLVDNLNASIHLRALLTDLFLIDEVLTERRAART
ncbi:MAG TPA: hypothetical protein VF329_05720 [Gammaproteobacteria bacterium]